MKRFKFNYPDSLTNLVSIPYFKEEKNGKGNQGYSREFQAMADSLEEEDYAEEDSHPSEKKKRLAHDQVKGLEKNYEVNNKLEPERKLKLADELGLQPRQVAIWFQNRRARSKTKQLERDYGSLRANYEALKVDYTKLQQEHESLTLKLKELKAKPREENIEDSCQSAKGDFVASESENNVSEHCQTLDFSDTIEMVNDCTNTIISSPHDLVNWIQLSDSRTILGNGHKMYQPHLVKVEDYEIFGAEESCNFFSVDQPPTLHWYFPDQ